MPNNSRRNGVLRYPRLDTVLMVEKSIKKYDGKYTKKLLWGKLPKRMMYQTFCLVIDYLLYSRKISIDAEGKIGWIFYPKEVSERIKHKHLFYWAIEDRMSKEGGVKKFKQKEALEYIKNL